MWSDSESSEDYMNFSDVVDNLYDIVNNTEILPVSIGVYGAWGSGKSTVLGLLKNKLDKKKHLIINYDSWLYQGFDDAKISLMNVIAENVREEVRENEGLLEKCTNLLQRIDYFKVATLVAKTGLAAATGGTSLILDGGVGLTRILQDKGVARDATNVEGAIKSAAPLWKPKQEQTVSKEITEFRREFGDLLNEVGKTVVVFVDNLDRCLPDTAIGVLEAVHLFLFMPKTVFVIAADRDMVKNSVRKYYSMEEKESPHVSNYLDKIIQFPITVPFIGVQELKAYMYMLYVGKYLPAARMVIRDKLSGLLQNIWTGAGITPDVIKEEIGASNDLQRSITVVDQIAPFLASFEGIQGNPRTVKRLLNDLELRRRIAGVRKIPISIEVLAKLLVFERCIDGRLYKWLVRVVVEAKDGHADQLKQLELVNEFSSFKEQLPDVWKNETEETVRFFFEWIRVEPMLGDVDLRGAVYLSRDVMPFYERGYKASLKVMNMLETLMNAKSFAITNRLVSTLSSEEQRLAMKEIVRRLQKITNWSQAVSGVHAMIDLTKRNEDCCKMAEIFFCGFPSGVIGRWVHPLLEGVPFVDKIKFKEVAGRIKKR